MVITVVLQAHWREREEEEGDFIFPYDLGRKRNFLMVFGYASSRELDGYWWPVVDECDQFTLTVCIALYILQCFNAINITLWYNKV